MPVDVVTDQVQMNVRVSKSVAAAAKRIAAHRGITMGELLELAVQQLILEDAAAIRKQFKAERDQAEQEQRAFEEQLAELSRR